MRTNALVCLCVLLLAALAAFAQNSPKTSVPAVAAVAQTPYSFMGLSPGQSQEESAAIIEAMKDERHELEFRPPFIHCQSGPGFTLCNFAHVHFPMVNFILNFVDDKSASITYTFHHRNYESMVQAIVKKYGPATSDTVEFVQNRMGASFQAHNHSWSNGTMQIDSSEYFSTIDESSIVVSDPKLAKEFVKRVLDNGPKI